MSSGHTTEHRPSKDELLAAMQDMYGEYVTWEDMYVIYEKDNDQRIKITDPEIVFAGDMSPDIVGGEKKKGMENYEEAREELSEDDEGDE